MLTVYYEYYCPHVGWFWTSKRIAGLKVHAKTQDARIAFD